MAANLLNPKAFGLASAAVAFLMDAAGYVWHGMLQQPSIMNLLYPGFWSSPSLLFFGLVGTVVGAYAAGYVFAWLYNRANKK